MRVLMPSRFRDIRPLREGRAIKTFIAADSSLEKSTVVVKLFRKRYCNIDRSLAEGAISLFMGMRHPCLCEFSIPA